MSKGYTLTLTDSEYDALKARIAQLEAALRELLLAAAPRSWAAELVPQRGATFFCQNAGYICERCGQHKYKHSPTFECVDPAGIGRTSYPQSVLAADLRQVRIP
jgi:hypothetical protein